MKQEQKTNLDRNNTNNMSMNWFINGHIFFFVIVIQMTQYLITIRA